VLDRAERVPNLFVKVTEVEEADTALESAPADRSAVAPAGR
jgi:hypothetical protein